MQNYAFIVEGRVWFILCPSFRGFYMHEHLLRRRYGLFCSFCSRDGKYIAVALLDSTVKVFFEDSLKFSLSLYGHRLPVRVTVVV